MTSFMKSTGSLTPDCHTIIDFCTHSSAKTISDLSTIEVPNNHDHAGGGGLNNHLITSQHEAHLGA